MTTLDSRQFFSKIDKDYFLTSATGKATVKITGVENFPSLGEHEVNLSNSVPDLKKGNFKKASVERTGDTTGV
ncbi:hypothetical protein, partial [Escherichia coli]|uniref:hypothetical protein n=1 Tax=Escherichia coli TaxID=562 RepID=UPI003CE56266